jgi:hypothetical protein
MAQNHNLDATRRSTQCHTPPPRLSALSAPPRYLFLLFILMLCLAATAAAQTPPRPAPAKDSCVECHAIMPPPYEVSPQKFAEDVHARKGLRCVDCHGGDPSQDDAPAAMNPRAGFRGKIQRAQIPAFCGSCHSDPAYMRRFDPSVRTDQLSQYRTSIHGQRLARGDTKVAVCTDCHSVHDIKPASDTRSTVHPLNVARTCSTCHSNAEHMKGYSIPTDQYASYAASVHHKALAVRGDLSAPTCSTCHGNHGAAPPGVASVEAVCATCHVFQAQLFDSSPHKPAFAAMGIAPCITCHSNHRINPPTDEMLGTGEKSVCITCHAPGDAGYQVAEQFFAKLTGLDKAIAQAADVLGRAERSGMEVSEAKLESVQARNALTKARVTIHAFDLARLEEDIKVGQEIAAKTHQAGLAALAERDYRRKGLAFSLIAILLVLIGLRLYIRKIEAPSEGT